MLLLKRLGKNRPTASLHLYRWRGVWYCTTVSQPFPTLPNRPPLCSHQLQCSVGRGEDRIQKFMLFVGLFFFFTVGNLVVKIQFWNIIFNKGNQCSTRLHVLYILKISSLFWKWTSREEAWVFCEFSKHILMLFSRKLCWRSRREPIIRGRRDKEEIPFIPDLWDLLSMTRKIFFLKWKIERETELYFRIEFFLKTWNNEFICQKPKSLEWKNGKQRNHSVLTLD